MLEFSSLFYLTHFIHFSPPRGPKGGEKKDGKGEEKRVHVKKEEGEEVAQVKEIKRRNLANEIEQEKKLTPEVNSLSGETTWYIVV